MRGASLSVIDRLPFVSGSLLPTRCRTASWKNERVPYERRIMKLGIITDIHEHVECLRAVLDELAGQVDRIVMVGDVVETGERIEETCQLLSDAGVVGVWGNHDYGF